jgi:hypothetical protein
MQHSQSPEAAMGRHGDVNESYMSEPRILVNIAHSLKNRPRLSSGRRRLVNALRLSVFGHPRKQTSPAIIHPPDQA